MDAFDIFENEPVLETTPRLTLEDKHINGPAAAHKIEELHTPLCFAFTSFSTGSSALPNVIGVTFPEIEARCRASLKMFRLAGLKSGDCLLVTYPPLINVFPAEALARQGLKVRFLRRSSRGALLESLSEIKPAAIIGESSFIHSTMLDAEKLGRPEMFSEETTIIAAGAPMNMNLLAEAEKRNIRVHDLYGCQEFGWLACDGLLLRDDISFVPAGGVKENSFEVVVGGLPTGDIMPFSPGGHVCCRSGKLITYRRRRASVELNVIVKESTLSSTETVRRTARSIMRLKGKNVFVSPDLVIKSTRTVLELKKSAEECPPHLESFLVCGGEKTEMFDAIARAQLDYQRDHRESGVWDKHERI